MKTAFVVTKPYDDAPINGIFSTPMDAFEKMTLSEETRDDYIAEEYLFNEPHDYSKDFQANVKVNFTHLEKYSIYESDRDFCFEFEFFRGEDALKFERELAEKYPQGFGNAKSFEVITSYSEKKPNEEKYGANK